LNLFERTVFAVVIALILAHEIVVDLYANNFLTTNSVVKSSLKVAPVGSQWAMKFAVV
jgi:hypothetical protein